MPQDTAKPLLSMTREELAALLEKERARADEAEARARRAEEDAARSGAELRALRDEFASYGELLAAGLGQANEMAAEFSKRFVPVDKFMARDIGGRIRQALEEWRQWILIAKSYYKQTPMGRAGKDVKNPKDKDAAKNSAGEADGAAAEGAELLRLGIYELCTSGGAMQNYEDWLAENYLPGAAPLDGWKISALLASVSQERIDAYFKDRHESIMERRRKAGLTSASGRPMLMAVDSTGISTWSETIGDAAYGHAKQDPFLKQVNLTICTDYETGDACYAYISEGSVNDMTLFPELLMRMQSAGFDLSEVLIVTDRGYSSMQNVQKQLNCGLKFLTGIKLSEDAIRRQFDKYEGSLRNMAFLNGGMGIYARSAEPEKWTSHGDGMRIEHSVHVHLYRNPRLEADQTLAFQCELEALLKAKNAGRAVDASKWARYKKFLIQPAQGSDKWTVKASAVQKANRHNGCFAIRTNVVADPFEALAIYNERGTVESAFRQFKVLNDGRRLMAAEASYKGKILLHLLAQGLRMMAMARLQDKSNSLKGKLPGDSLVKAMWILRKLQASRPAGRGAWLTKELPRSTRELMQALGVGLPGRILKD